MQPYVEHMEEFLKTPKATKGNQAGVGEGQPLSEESGTRIAARVTDEGVGCTYDLG